jgi:hypothetical protein
MNFELIAGERKICELQKTLGSKTWPEFMQHDRIVNQYWPNLYTDFLNFQFALFDSDVIVGVGNALPLNLPRSFDELP